VTVDPLDEGLSQIVRRQLHDLQIDPDGVSRPRRGTVSRLHAWCRAHTQAVLLGGTGILVLLTTIVAALLVSATIAQPQGGMQTASQSTSTSVSLGDLTVQMTAPSYQRFPMGQAVLVLHLDVQNTSDTQVALLASDLLLVDSHGSLFPPSWRDTDGTSHDGLANLNHTLGPRKAAPIAAAGVELAASGRTGVLVATFH
jgi:hypothetical protein